MRLTITCLLLAGALAVTAAPAAHATHDEDCRPYSIETTPLDEIGVEAGVIAADLVVNQIDAAGETAEEADPGVGADKPFRIAAGIAVGVEYAIRLSLLILNGINAEADECRIDAHWRMTDDLLAAQIRRDLASTGTPVALFVLPGSIGEGDEEEAIGGYIDHEGIGARVIVRDTIDRMKAENQCTCTAAESSYANAVTAMDNGNYKQAYTLFRQAYKYAFSN